MEPLIALGILWLLGRRSPATTANVTPAIVPSPVAPPVTPPPVVTTPPPAPVPITVTPVYRTPSAPPPTQAPVTNPNAQGVPVPTAPPTTVVTIDRQTPTPTPPPDNRPGFCRGPWMPFQPRACSGSEPVERRGPAPDGAWVVTGPVPGAQRSFNQSSCPDASRGLYIMQAGSLDWNNLCGRNQPIE